MSDGFVENFNLINCYVDTSYYSSYYDTILQVNSATKIIRLIIRYYLIVVANQSLN